MDSVIVQIANDPGGPWFTIFNWGNGSPDTNTNVSSYPENDNEPIPLSALYNGPPQTGITIDVDGAGVPAGTYQYLVIIAPSTAANDGADVDSIEILP